MRTENRPPLTLASYQQALLTQGLRFPTGPSYLVPNIVGQVGALFALNASGALFATESPETRAADRMRANVYSDMVARVAILLHGLGVTRLQPAYPANGPRDDRDPMLRLLQAATGVYRTHILGAPAEGLHPDTDEWLIDSAENLWRTLRGGCAVAGVPFQTVLRASLSETAAL